MVIVAAGRSIGVSRTKKMHFEAGVFWVRRDFGQFCTGGGWEIRDVDQSRSPRNQSRLQLTPHSAAADARSCCTRIQGSAPMHTVAKCWHHRVSLNVDREGPTLWPMDRSGLGLRRTLRRVPAVQKNELHTWYLAYEYPGTAVYVF